MVTTRRRALLAPVRDGCLGLSSRPPPSGQARPRSQSGGTLLRNFITRRRLTTAGSIVVALALVGVAVAAFLGNARITGQAKSATLTASWTGSPTLSGASTGPPGNLPTAGTTRGGPQ